jgi:subtilase family serine protease
MNALPGRPQAAPPIRLRLSRRALAVGATLVAVAGLASGAAAATAPTAAAKTLAAKPVASTLGPQLVTAPADTFISNATSANAACVLPDGTGDQYYHCYTPQQIRGSYGIDKVAPLADGAPNYGQGQTIVLVDSYGSPTAASDLRHFHDTFFPGLPDPNFQEIYPLGNPPYQACNGQGKDKSGACAAAGWTGEATLDIEWAYSIAPEAHLILLAVPPAETEGVQGFPTLFKAISNEISALPAGTMFSMSFAVTEQTFGGAAASQSSKFDAVFQQGLAKNDNFFAAAGDGGTWNASKSPGQGGSYSYPTAQWPASSPYVVAVGGTQLMDGWTWDPTSNDPSTAGYFNSTQGGDSQAVWNESWGDIGTGGGASVIYSRPSWQASADPALGDHRIVPDTSWNAAVNGGVDVYITAYPEYNCGNTTGCWTFYGGTSASTPQTAALVALVNAARSSAGKPPIGFLDPILYSGVGSSSAYTDIVPEHYGSAPATFAGSDVGVTGTVTKSVGDLVDNQMWEAPPAGYATTAGYDATTGWGTPNAPSFVSALLAHS